MKDFELLEFAALAANLEIKSRSESNLWVDTPGFGLRVWNPLEDDGDAFRLAVKLGMFNSVDFYLRFVTPEDSSASCSNTRRAIVKAAAEVGQSLHSSYPEQLLG
ncbi:hypothetical protein IQ22_04681 [Pseudomonas duriflava]|uniref:Uncharacterized protein n=1 Tax=Pseudomonas duriflava TaxID=459528 RepID=A0A562PKQ0_9PSED|nr:hypothetical protein [Pseudomonas duriflava]TWI45042.1 hypothetical protein IQ22_04681 [Pseudomonas duriflava]